MKRPIGLLVVAACLLAAACASESSTGRSAQLASAAPTATSPKPSEPSTAPTASSAKPPGNDEPRPSSSATPAPLCGGVGGTQCPAGMTCKMPNPPGHPDQMGNCVGAPGKLGGPCAGFAAIPCEQGLVCDLPKPSAPDQAGTCVKP